MPTTTEKLLADVVDLVHTRGSVYGHPYTNHKRISELWSAYLDHPITPSQVALCMALVKVSRISESPSHSDSIVDAIAYLSIYQTVLDAETDINYTWGDD
jgi:hypothetical protein